MFLADFHVHSTFSDGKHTIPELVDFYGSRGFGAVAFTDHLCEESTVLGRASAYLGCSLTPASFPLYTEILKSEKERAWDQYRMVVIPGFELTKNSISNHRSAHVLGIGITDFISASLDFPELAKRIREQGGISVAAHPVWTRKWEKQTYQLWSRRHELRSVFDAWEVASGPYIFDEVVNTKLPKIASSDLHMIRQMSSWKTAFECERKEEAILDSVRRQEVSFRFYEEPNDFSYRYQINSLVGRGERDDLGDLDRAEAV